MTDQSTLMHELTLKMEQLQQQVLKDFGSEHIHAQKCQEILNSIAQTLQQEDISLINHVFEYHIIPKVTRLTHQIAQKKKLYKQPVTKSLRATLENMTQEIIAPPVALHRVAPKPQFSEMQQQGIDTTLKNLQALLKVKY